MLSASSLPHLVVYYRLVRTYWPLVKTPAELFLPLVGFQVEYSKILTVKIKCVNTFDFCTSVVGFCNFETTDEGVRGTYQWNETEVGSNASVVCFYGPPDAIATRFCASRNNLRAPSLENCRTIASTRFNNMIFENVRYTIEKHQQTD